MRGLRMLLKQTQLHEAKKRKAEAITLRLEGADLIPELSLGFRMQCCAYVTLL